MATNIVTIKIQEKEELTKTRANIRTVAEAKAYKEKVLSLNERIADFEKRRRTFNSQANEFNKEMKDKMEKNNP